MQQEIKVSHKQLLDLIARDFFQSLVQRKQMFIQTSTDVLDKAVSPIIKDTPVKGDCRYGVEHYKTQEKFRIQLWMFKEANSQPTFRQVELQYKEILEDIVKAGGGSPIDAAENMYQILSNITDEQWDKIEGIDETRPTIHV